MDVMVVIHRAHGFRFVIYTMDHEPAHVHAIGDGELKVSLATDDGEPEIVWSKGMRTSDLRRAMAVVREKQAEFLAHWQEMHGDER